MVPWYCMHADSKTAHAAFVAIMAHIALKNYMLCAFLEFAQSADCIALYNLEIPRLHTMKK